MCTGLYPHRTSAYVAHVFKFNSSLAILAGVSFPGSKAHLANWVIDADISVMITICAQPAPTQTFPWRSPLCSFGCLFVFQEYSVKCFLLVLKAIPEAIRPPLRPTHPTFIKQAVQGIHQVSIRTHTLDLMVLFIK